MTLASKILTAAIGVIVTTSVANAQTCMGLPPFTAGRVQVGASGDFGNDSRGLTGSLTIGSPGGAFAGIAVGTVSYDEFDGSTTAVGGQLGWQLPIGTGNVHLCPIAAAIFGFGPDNIEGSGTDASSWNAAFGLQLGFSAGGNQQLRIVPTAGAALAYSKAKFEGGLFAFEADETYGILSLGVGLLMNTRVSLLPSVEIPVGLEDSDPAFGIMLAVNFGRRG